MASAVVLLAGCQPVPASPLVSLTLGPDRVGYLLFRAPITEQSRGFFVADIEKMLALGATDIHIAINSPGGSVAAAEAMMNYMDQVHRERGTTFTTYNVGVVASAACYVFLAGQRRYATPRGAFLFHEVSLQANGALTSQALHEATVQMEAHERIFLNALKTRTHLSDGEALSFVRRTVILTAEEARRDGITDGTADFAVPRGTPTAVIGVVPAPGTRPQAMTAGAG